MFQVPSLSVCAVPPAVAVRIDVKVVTAISLLQTSAEKYRKEFNLLAIINGKI